MKPGLINFLNAFFSGLLSFISLGMFWVGLSPIFQVVVSLLYLGLGVFAMKKSESNTATTIASILVGAVPVALLIARFRSKDDSHLLGLSIVASWVVAVLLGVWLGRKKENPI